MYSILVFSPYSSTSGITEYIRSAFKADEYETIVRSFTDRESLLSFAELNPFLCDIVFVDFLNMTNNNISASLDLAKAIYEIRYSTQFIFMSDIDLFNPKLYEVTHVYYLANSVKASHVKRALVRAIKNIQALPLQFVELIPIMVNKKYIVENIYNIMYMRIVLRYVEIVTASGEKYLVRKTLTELKGMIDNPHLIRCHKSFIINSYYIKRFEKNWIIMRDGFDIPVSRCYGSEHEEKILASFQMK